MFVTRSSKRQHFSQRDATSLNESSWNLDRIPPRLQASPFRGLRPVCKQAPALNGKPFSC